VRVCGMCRRVTEQVGVELMLWSCIREMLGLSLDGDTGYLD
jgi:hypothetical protein